MTNVFTQEQINEIAKKLASKGIRDTQLPSAETPLSGEEIVTIVQDGTNRILPLSDLITHFKINIDSIDRLIKIGENGNWFINGLDTSFKAVAKDGYTPMKGVDYFDGAEGKIGLTGKQGEIGPTGKDGLIGPRGYTGEQGEQGLEGKEGKRGLEGPEGKMGLTGAEGKRGATGEQGIQGKQGLIGLTGPRGLDFKYEDFTEQQLLLLKGATGSRGATGEAFKVDVVGSLASKNNFDTTKGGFAYLDADNSHLYIKLSDVKGHWSQPVLFGKGDKGRPFEYNDFTPSQLESIRGPRGLMGFIGEQGERGESFKYHDFTEAQILDLKQPAIQASIDANQAKTLALDTLRRTDLSLIQVDVAVADSILKTSQSKTATIQAEEATVIALNSKGPKGDPFRVDAVGTLAQRSLHDDKALGYCFLDYVGNKFYVKKSETIGDWTDGITFVGSVGNVNSEEYSDVYYGNAKIHSLKDEGDPIYALTTPEAVIDVVNNMTLRDHIKNIPVIEILTEAEFDSLVDKDENKFYFIQED